MVPFRRQARLLRPCARPWRDREQRALELKPPAQAVARPCPAGNPSRQGLQAWPARRAAAPAVLRPALRTVEPEALREGNRLSSAHPFVREDDSAAISAKQEQTMNNPHDFARWAGPGPKSGSAALGQAASCR